MVARFKDDGYSAFKEITRDDFVRLIDAIEARRIDVVIVRDIDRLTRNLTDWNRFEKAACAMGYAEPVYRRGPGPVHPGGCLLRGDGDAAREAGKRGKSVRVREAKEREAREASVRGRPEVVRVHACVCNPDEPIARKRVILREDLNPVEAERCETPRRACSRGAVRSIIREWTKRGIKPAVGRNGRCRAGRHADSPRARGLAGMAGEKYPTTDWPAIIDVDTHERLVKLFGDPSRRTHIVGRKITCCQGPARAPNATRPL